MSSLINLTHCKSILYLHRREPCNYYAHGFSMDRRFPYYYAPGSFPMRFHNFSCYNPMQARPDLDLQRPNGILASAQNRSISPTSTSSNSSNSPSGSKNLLAISNSLDYKVMLLIPTKIIRCTVIGCFNSNMRAFNSTNNVW